MSRHRAGRILHLIRHDDFELPGGIVDWAARRGWDIREIRFFEGETAPPPQSGSPAWPPTTGSERTPEDGNVDLLVIMGGTMSANDDATLRWLPVEKRWIAAKIASPRTRTIGICLGAQILASILGSRVYRSPHREIGWFSVRRVGGVADSPLADAIPAEHESFLWHTETFDIPTGCVRLAESECCPNQAFSWRDRLIAVQFHPEMTAESARAIVAESGHEVVPGPYVQEPAGFIEQPERFETLDRVMHRILDRMADITGPPGGDRTG